MSQSGYDFFQVAHLKVHKDHSDHIRIIDIFLYFFVATIAILLLIMLCTWRNRVSAIVNKFALKQLDSMDLDLIQTITNRSMLEAIADLTRDETMEIDKESISVLEVLGEGAFGLVKKAILVRDGMKRHVAVKMLKSKISMPLMNENNLTSFLHQIAQTLTTSSNFIRR